MQVVDYYRKYMVGPGVTSLLNCNNLRHGLRAFFRGLANLVTGIEAPPGCLIACLLSEECCESELIKMKLATFIENADQTFAKIFASHREELNPALTPEVAGKLLLSTVHGLSIRARSGADKRTLQEVGDAFLELVLRNAETKS
jgi:hypothetical protein